MFFCPPPLHLKHASLHCEGARECRPLKLYLPRLLTYTYFRFLSTHSTGSFGERVVYVREGCPGEYRYHVMHTRTYTLLCQYPKFHRYNRRWTVVCSAPPPNHNQMTLTRIRRESQAIARILATMQSHYPMCTSESAIAFVDFIACLWVAVVFHYIR